MEKIRLYGRKEFGGVVEAEALVSKVPLMGWLNCNAQMCCTTERNHPLKLQSYDGKILVYPTPRGSGGFMSYGWKSEEGRGAAGFVHNGACALTATCAQNARVPSITDFEVDPSTVIETGDIVLINADEGYIEITKKGSK